MHDVSDNAKKRTPGIHKKGDDVKTKIISIYGGTLFECDAETVIGAVLMAIKGGANLRGADLSGADLSGAKLFGANLGEWKYMSIRNIGSESGELWVIGKCDLVYHRGCFSGSKDDFLSAVSRKHGGTKIEAEYKLAVELIELRLGAKR